MTLTQPRPPRTPATARQHLLLLADHGPFRRGEARAAVGSAAYADRALRALIGEGLLERVRLRGHAHYARSRESGGDVAGGPCSAADLAALRRHFQQFPQGITGGTLGTLQGAADALVRTGELTVTAVGHARIYRPALRIQQRGPACSPSPDLLSAHHPEPDPEGMNAPDAVTAPVGTALPAAVGGLVLKVKPGAALLDLGDAQHNVELPDGVGPAVGDYLWLKPADGHDPAAHVLLNGAALARQTAGQSEADLPPGPQRADFQALRLLGVPAGLAFTLCRSSGSGGRHHHDPYRLVPHLGFTATDALARHAGVLPDHPGRHAALCAELVRRHTLLGHTSLRAERAVSQLEDAALSADEARAALERAARRGLLLRDEDRLYLPGALRDETELAERLTVHLARVQRPLGSGVPPAPTAYSSLDAQQRSVLSLALRHPLSLLTGGPGTGKSSTLRALCEHAETLGLQVTLCAPTGKAAARLQDATGRPALTLHRLLGSSPRGFARNEHAPLVTDLLVLDEASMVGDALLLHLTRALSPGTRVLLVGDANQLPPIDGGEPLQALLGRVPTTRLHRVYRQAGGSRIRTLATAVLTGDDVDWSSEVRVCEDADRAARFAAGAQLLTPTRAGPFGAAALNEAVQASLGLTGGVAIRDGVAHPGDPVLQTVNDYAREVMNGQIGRAVSVSTTETVVDFDGRNVVYRGAERLALQPAYSVTVHRAQGSEWTDVAVVLHESHLAMLSRTLAYTALTRARDRVTLLGSPLAWEVAASRVQPPRDSHLKERLSG